MTNLPQPIEGAIIYEDEQLYVCLANYPIAAGHTVVVWKDKITDLYLLKKEDYEHLMDVVDQARNALIAALKIEKVYLMYMDEVKHVHWHLIPRFNETGFNVLAHEPSVLKDVSLVAEIKSNWRTLQ